MKLLLVLLFAVTVSASAQAQSTPPQSFQLDAQAKRALVAKALALKPGDSYQSVTNQLGKPTYDQTGTTKQPPHRFIHRSLKYYAVIRRVGMVTESEEGDQLVSVYLDEHDRVRSVSFRVTLE